MELHYPMIPFERYMDDAIVHCRTRKKAERIKAAIDRRFKECKLELHPGKTKVVYCKDANRKLNAPVIMFDFLGFTFKPRKSRSKKGVTFLNFTPAVSLKSKKKMTERLNEINISRSMGKTLQQFAQELNPIFRGWINYFEKFGRFKLCTVFMMVNRLIAKWALKRYKRLKKSWRRTWKWLADIARQNPTLFIHWNAIKCVPT